MPTHMRRVERSLLNRRGKARATSGAAGIKADTGHTVSQITPRQISQHHTGSCYLALLCLNIVWNIVKKSNSGGTHAAASSAAT